MILTLNLRKRLLLFLFVSIIGFFINIVISGLLMYKFPESTAALRIATMTQDVFMFIIPAIVTAVMVTPQAAELLGIRRTLPILPLCLGVFVVVASTPVMNLMIWLNTNVPLPENIAHQLQALEDNANSTVARLMGPHDVPNLIVTLLIVAVMAGFSEELFFRGALQRLLITGRVNAHAAIWITAMVFSLMHLQFYGFVPRLLLGASFGYAFYWTRNIWVPICMHIFNNALYIVYQWLNYGKETAPEIDSLGVSGNLISDVIIIVISAALVFVGFKLLYTFRNSPERVQQN